MSPAKKKKAAIRRKPPRKAASALPMPPPPEQVAVPVPAAAIPVPAPVLTQKERRFWKVIQTKNLIGGTMFLLGVGFCVGFWVSDKVHNIEKIVLGVGLFLIVFGAHFMSSEPTERALGALARTAGKVIPLVRKGNDTAEQKAPGGGV